MGKAIKRIGLALRSNNELVDSVLGELIEVLLANQMELSYVSADDTQRRAYDFPLLEQQEIAKRCDLILLVGGDGTFVRHFMKAARSQVPMLGINCGRVGFLTEIARKDIAAVLPAILKGDYHRSSKIVMKGIISQDGAKLKELYSVNDLVVHTLGGRMMEAKLMIDDKFVYCERSDGIIVATAAGSSAYALSAGGPLISHQARAIAVVNISPHTLTSRPLILPDSSRIRIELVSQEQVAVYADGSNQIEIAQGAALEIAKDELTVPMIHHKDYDIFSAYRSKLGWHSSSDGADKR